MWSSDLFGKNHTFSAVWNSRHRHLCHYCLFRWVLVPSSMNEFAENVSLIAGSRRVSLVRRRCLWRIIKSPSKSTNIWVTVTDHCKNFLFQNFPPRWYDIFDGMDFSSRIIIGMVRKKHLMQCFLYVHTTFMQEEFSSILNFIKILSNPSSLTGDRIRC